MKGRSYWIVPLLAGFLACTMSTREDVETEIAALGAPLDSVTGLDAPEVVTEIGDGVIVTPAPMLPGILRVSLVSGEQDSIGRAGDGPGEFRSPFFVQLINDGSVLVLDGLARRVTILDSSLTFSKQFTDFGGLSPFTLRYDTLGNSYSVATASGPFTNGDTLAILRRRANETTLDTISFVQRLQVHPLQFGANMMMVPAEYAPRDIWGIHPDGDVWVARGARRELERIAADGTVSRSPLPFAAIPTSDADRRLFRGLPAPAAMDTVTRVIAPTKGPFQEVRAAPDGHLFLWLNQPAVYSRELVAEFDRQGRLLRTFSIPAASKLVAVSRAYVYTTQESADGTWVLRRHPRPS